MRFFGLALVIFLFSCEVSDYNELGDCAKEKLIRFGDGELKLKDAEFLKLNYSMVWDGADSRGFQNSVLLSDYDINIFGSELFNKALERKTTGDSLYYVLCYSEIKGMVLDEFSRNDYPLRDEDTVRLNIGIELCMTAKEYLDYRAEQVRVGLVAEMELIEKYIEDHKLRNKLTRKGDLYYMKLKDYGSEKVKVGDDVSLSYSCTFLDGEVFDQVTENEPVYVNLGTPDQLVQGFESALKEIGEKEEVMIIIPSYLAFGEDGSSNGQVPEKTPIIITATILEKFN